MQTRAIAAAIIDDVMQNRTSLSIILEKRLSDINSARDKAFIQDICYGVFRWIYQLEHYLEQLLEKPLKAKDSSIKALLLVGLYQLYYQRTPDHAAVSATVDACRDLKKNWAKQLVNAVLRRFIRDEIANQEISNIEADCAHPKWMIDQLRNDWTDHWQMILEANQQKAPLTLRINRQIISRDDYLNKLNRHAIIATPAVYSKYGITLETATDINILPGYAEGEFSVQDQAAQFAAELLDLKPGHRVLDACAAPGGKTCHCLELQPKLSELLAIDNHPNRLQRLTQNLNRLRLPARTHIADVSVPSTWWDDIPFDRILLDAPCTASGVIRRHPDIKYLRTAEDLHNITQTQASILQNIWPLLQAGGKLVYATCSVFKAENDQQIRKFLQRHDDAQLSAIESQWGIATEYGRQILPGQDDMDGFYYCCIIKT